MARKPGAKTAKILTEGVDALRAGRFADAVDRFRRALKREPRLGDLHYHLALALEGAGDPAAALVALTDALAHDARHQGAAHRLSGLLRRFVAPDPAALNPRGLSHALGFRDVDGRAIGRAGFAHLETAPGWKEAFAAAADGIDAAARGLLAKPGRRALGNALLLETLARALVEDPAWERLLTALRRALLAEPALLDDGAVAGFACALIRQCLNNEFVFFVSPEEAARVDALAVGLADLRPDDAADARTLALLALYRPVDALLSAMDGDGGAAAEAIALAPLRALAVGHLAARWREAELAAEIPPLKDIRDGISRAVAGQYEANPYPRWLSQHLPGSGAWRRLMAAHFGPGELAALDGEFKVLIAGCGTGEQAVRAAHQYGPAADVLALDLSRASLGYARRMAADYGLDNLRWRWGDLLDAGDLGETFQVIESVGVLHHMAEPYAGWAVLADRLAPGGMMFVGLYSATARRAVAGLRQAFDARFDAPTADNIRAFRHALMDGEISVPGIDVAASADAYSLSDFRDLALHENEIPCRLADIAAFLGEHGLDFRGFVLRPDRLVAFTEAHGEPALRDLDAWRRFEDANPDTFDGMYLFWVGKPA